MSPTRRVFLVCLPTLVVAPLFGLIVLLDPISRLSRPNYDELQIEGGKLITAIEQYRWITGHYPESLTAASIVAPKSHYGPWEYKLSGDGKSFSLTIGDYEKDGFVYVYYSGEGGSWHVEPN